MINPIKQIHDFNHKAGLATRGYNDALESSMLVEEALEGFSRLPNLAKALNLPSDLDATPKQLSRDIIAAIHNADLPISDVDRLDKACDAAIIAIGSMVKLGLNPNQITRSINTVMQANLIKVNQPTDSVGKLTKPANFEGPEYKLQSILNERG